MRGLAPPGLDNTLSPEAQVAMQRLVAWVLDPLRVGLGRPERITSVIRVARRHPRRGGQPLPVIVAQERHVSYPRPQTSGANNNVTNPERDAPSMSLAEAMREVVDRLRGQSASGGDAPDDWERIVRIIAEHDGLPDREVKVIETAIADAYRGWSDAQRRSIWYETDSGMTDDDDDDSLFDTSLNGIGYALQVEMLDEVTQAAWRDAAELKNAAPKSHRRTKG